MYSDIKVQISRILTSNTRDSVLHYRVNTDILLWLKLWSSQFSVYRK